MEKLQKTLTRNSRTSGNAPPEYAVATIETPRVGFWRDLIDGFKRDPNARTTSRLGPQPGRSQSVHGDGLLGSGGTSATNSACGSSDGHRGRFDEYRYFDAASAAYNTANSPLSRSLRGRHLQMIAIGGAIGTGLFVSSGGALSDGGPASLLIAFGMIGVMIYCTVHALGELAVRFPVAGSFSAYSTRFLDPSWGFAMGWNYFTQWLIVLPLEAISATLVLEYWNPGVTNNAFVAVFLFVMISINLFGVKGYGEAEFVFSIIKVIAVISFILLGTILTIDPQGKQGQYWRDPGAFNNGFKGLCSTFVTAAFAFAGTELVGLAAAETRNPRATLPTAIKQVFWRIALFYIVALTLVGLLVPYNDGRLLNAEAVMTKSSPFVIAIENAGIEVLPSILNAVILIAVLSVGNASVYGSSRTLAALAEQGQAPRFLAYIDRKGRPLLTILIAAIFGLLSFFAGSRYQEDALTWLIAISGLSSIFTWGSICLAHIRFRHAWARQGHTLSELAFRSQPGVYGSWLGLVLNILVLIAQFWTGFAPIDYGAMSPKERVKSWFQVYLAAPIVLIFFIAHKLWYRTSIVRTKDMDLDTGVRELDVAALVEEEKRIQSEWPRWKKVYKFFC